MLSLAVFGALFAKTLLMRKLALNDSSVWEAFLVDGSFLLGCVLVVDALFADLRLKAYAVLDLVVSVLLLVVTVYTSFYGQVPTPAAVRMARQAATVTSSITTLLRPVYLLYFADVAVLLVAAYVWPAIRRNAAKDPADETFTMLPAISYALVIPALAMFASGVVAVRHLPEPTDSLAASRTRGVFAFLTANIRPNTMGMSVSRLGPGAKASDFQKVADSLSGRVLGEPLAGFEPGQAKGKNVIIIQVEALQAFAVGRTVGGKAVTPNLDALAEDSWYFPNCVSGGGLGTTADVEFVVNTSLYPPSEVGASLGWPDRRLTSMPRVLGAKGYDALTFHTNEAGFWNRRQFYAALGWTRYFDQAFFGRDDPMAFGASSDRVLFEKTLPVLKGEQEVDKPFYAQLITVSSHFPFDNVPKERRTLHPGAPYDGTILGDYLAEEHYADEQIGYFISQLKESGLWDDSIVVVYGDHFGLPEPRNGAEASALRTLLGRDYDDADRALVPLIIHLPGQTQGTRVTNSVGQIDIAPSLADALDLDLSGMLGFGSSVFRSGHGLTAVGGLFETGSYADGSALYIPGSGTGHAFDVTTHKPSSLPATYEATSEHAKELLLLSREYTAGLPKRPDFDPNAEITFPRKKK